MCDPENPLVPNEKFNGVTSVKNYEGKWGCTYTSPPAQVNSNHYGSSDLRTKLKGLETDTAHFSTSEQALMTETTITTADTKNNTTYTTIDKLYAAYGVDSETHIMVGTSTGGLKIELTSGPYAKGRIFWLRSPSYNNDSGALLAFPGSNVNYYFVPSDNAVVPAFNLNLSSVIFASAASASSSDGTLTTSDAMTLRYAPVAGSTIGSAVISASQTSIDVSGAPANTYLVVQNDSGAWAKAVSGASTVSTSDFIGASLSSFAGCKVWLETTDATNRITTATLATTHTHTWSNDWTSNETNHWHTCTGCVEVLGKVAHIPGAAATETSSQVCTVCNYEIAPPLEHTHTFAPEWTSDETNHWHLATCAHMDVKGSLAAHDFGKWVTDTEATETEKGSKHRACTVCGKSETEEIPATGKTPAKPTITAGAGSNHQIGSGQNMTFTCSEKLEDLEGIYVDGKLADPNNYTLKSGSTVLTLKANYLDTLSVGKHTLKFQYKDSVSVETNFTITAKAGETPTPKPSSLQTGDSSNFMVLLTLLLASGGTLTALLARRRRTGRHYSK